MGLYSSISTALSGLQTAQSGMSIVSQNIANASTPGYTKKVLEVENAVAGDTSMGVRIAGVTREVDKFLQQQMRTEVANTSKLDVASVYMQRIESLFGAPEDELSIASAIDNLGAALQDLSTLTNSSSAASSVLTAAQNIADELNRLSNEVQEMRLNAEHEIADEVAEANQLMSQIAELNIMIGQRQDGSTSTADLEDQRDNALDALSEIFDINVVEQHSGTVSVFTNTGQLLVDTQAATLNFDERSAMGANALYENGGVGTITITNGSTTIDLIAAGAFSAGSIAGYLEMRDEVLVEAQAQLDELAAELALVLSEEEIEGTATTVAGADGFEFDIGELESGNSMSLTYTIGGVESTVTIIAVTDASLLPLADDVTAQTGDSVIGIDITDTQTNIVAALNAALPAEVVVTDEGGTTVAFTDDGGAGTSDINGLVATVVPDVLQGEGTGLALFLDSETSAAFTDSLDGDGQQLGFAGRIVVNSDLIEDPSLLVSYASTTAEGDNARPLDLYSRLKETSRTYATSTGIGGVASPYEGSIDSFAREFITYQAAQADATYAARDASAIVSDALVEKNMGSSGVNIDEEMSDLIILQNAYTANARVISAVEEMFDTLMTIGR
jgi:flagellar hook-associated protein 1 FlgK